MVGCGALWVSQEPKDNEAIITYQSSVINECRSHVQQLKLRSFHSARRKHQRRLGITMAAVAAVRSRVDEQSRVYTSCQSRVSNAIATNLRCQDMSHPSAIDEVDVVRPRLYPRASKRGQTGHWLEAVVWLRTSVDGPKNSHSCCHLGPHLIFHPSTFPGGSRPQVNQARSGLDSKVKAIAGLSEHKFGNLSMTIIPNHPEGLVM